MKYLLFFLLLTSPAWAQRTEDVHFAKGASSCHMVRTIAAGETLTLFLKARKGQCMKVSVASPGRNAVFEVFKEDNLLGEPRTVLWNCELKWDGTYQIRLSSIRGSGPAEATVDISIR
jgi:hypothetical protein